MKISKKKATFLVSLFFFVLILFSPLISLQFLKSEEKLRTGVEYCINGFFLHPNMYDVKAEFSFERKEFSFFKLCVLPNELLGENENYILNVELLGFFKKQLSLSSASYPQVKSPLTKEMYHIREKVFFALDNESIFTYYLSTAGKEAECSQENMEIICNLELLSLGQGLQYELILYSRYGGEKVQDLGVFTIQTPDPVLVLEASIKEGAVFHAEMSEISLNFNKEISPEFEIFFEKNSGEKIPFDFDLSGKQLFLKTKNSIKIGSVVKVVLKNVKGLDGSFLANDYILNFSVLEKPPKNWWEYPDEILPTVKSGDDLLVVVSKKYKLPSEYVPRDLVNVNLANIRTDKEILVRSIIIDDLRELGKAARTSGIDLSIVSGYRSYSMQASTYRYWLDINGGNVNLTDQVSARPGHSEHQLGTTVDFGTNKAGFATFNDTSASAWLEANAHNYGFVLSYPRDSQNVTGFKHEGWHYRYIGKDNAQRQKASTLISLQWLMQQ